MNFKEIKELIKLIQDTNLAEFTYKKDDVEVKIKTDKVGSKVATAPAIMPVSAPIVPATQETPAAAPSISADQGGKPEVSSDNSNLIEVKSPIVGTFYRSPGPDKDVFVKVGDNIEVGSVVCIVEAMKLFNEIESEVAGKIVKILVDDASPVEFDQPLFLVEA